MIAGSVSLTKAHGDRSEAADGPPAGAGFAVARGPASKRQSSSSLVDNGGRGPPDHPAAVRRTLAYRRVAKADRRSRYWSNGACHRSSCTPDIAGAPCYRLAVRQPSERQPSASCRSPFGHRLYRAQPIPICLAGSSDPSWLYASAAGSCSLNAASTCSTVIPNAAARPVTEAPRAARVRMRAGSWMVV